jgi:hypothetical protein
METRENEAPVDEAPECDQFICFVDLGITGIEEQDRYPVGVGKTRAEAFEMGIRNTLTSLAEIGFRALAQSSLVTVAQPQLPPDGFEALGNIIKEFFAEKEKLRGSTP